VGCFFEQGQEPFEFCKSKEVSQLTANFSSKFLYHAVRYRGRALQGCRPVEGLSRSRGLS
jgi:hypothetical protein